MKEKILAAIRAKFPKVNLSKKRLDAIAAKIETKVIDDETKIDAAIDDYNDFNPLADIAKQDDTIRNLEAKVKPAPQKKEDDSKPDPEAPKDEDAPPWAKSLIESNKTLSEKLAAIEGEKTITTMKSKAGELLKDVPKSYWSEWSIPQKEDEIESFVIKVQTGYEAFTKDLSDKGILSMPIPGGGNGGQPTKQASQEQINNVVDKIMI